MKCKKEETENLYNVYLGNGEYNTTLYDLADWKNGLAYKDIVFSDVGIPIIKIAELNSGINSNTKYTQQEFDRSVYLQNGDLLFSWSGNPETSIDVYRFNLKEGWLNQHIYKIYTYIDKIDNNYMYYLLKYLKPRFIKIARNKQTIGLGHVALSDIKNISINIHSKKNQLKIATILKSIDDKIELNNKINKNLADQVDSLYKKVINNSDAKIVKFSSIAVIGSGKRPTDVSNICNADNKIPLIGASSIMGYVNNYNYNEKVLVTGRVGTHGIIQRFNKPIWASDNTLVIKTKYYEFLYQVLKNVDWHSMNRGSTQPLITQSDLNNVDVILPNDKVLNDFESNSMILMNKYEHNILENEKLIKLRDSLLPKLMSGEIDVLKIDI